MEEIINVEPIDLATVNARSSRFKTAPWFIPGIDVIIGGIGGIGSWVSLFLGRQECNLYLFDMDMYEEHNAGAQFCNTASFGVNKALAMRQLLILDQFCKSDLNVNTFLEYNDSSPSNPIVFSCFDNMKARKVMFEKWCNYKNKELFIDGRLLSECYAIYAVTPDRIEDYRKELYDDSEIPEAPCGFKSTTFCAAGIASDMVGLFNNYMANKITKENIRVIPFRIIKEYASMSWETKN